MTDGVNMTSRAPGMTVKIAVIYYSATGTVHALAQAASAGPWPQPPPQTA
jgi:hypothetical protein